MKATKVIMPNGKERILIEVKPSEYASIESALTTEYSSTDGLAEKERKRMEVFYDAQTGSSTGFYDWAHVKES